MSLRSKKRLMLFTDSFRHGGSERQFVQALRHLDRNRFELLAGCLKREGPFLAEVEAMGIPVYQFPLRSMKSPSNIGWLRGLARFLREQEVDLVHAFEYYTSVMCAPAARLARVPAVVSLRDVVRAERLGLRWLLRGVCALATAVVMNSKAAGARLISRGPLRPEKFRLVYNGLDLAQLTPQQPRERVREQMGLPPGALAVGTLSALRPEKDVAMFLRAAALVAGECPETHFVLIGDGTERASLEALAQELHLDGRAHFLGDRHDVADLLSALDVFVLPSSTESLPNAVLEAMALGLPVVATDVGGTPEVMEPGRTGYLVPVGDAAAAAQRIRGLARDAALRRSLGTAAQEQVRERFSPRRMKEQLENLYDRLLRERHPTARVLQISNYPPPMDGWAIHVVSVQRRLAELGADSRVLDIGPGRRLRGRECVPVLGGLDYAAKLLAYRLRGFTFQPHVNGDSWKGYALALAAVLVGRLTGKPAVLMFHAGPNQLYFPRERGFWRGGFKLLFDASGAIVCNLDPVKRAIAGYGVPAEKIHAVFSVAYPEEELPAALPFEVEEFLRSHSPLLFSYSLFRPEFTMEALFDAFAEVRRKYANAGLLVAGPKEVPAEAQEQMRRLGVTEAVFIPGNLPHAEFLTAVQRSDIFVRTHLRDGLCASVLEALQLGVPVVAAEDGLRPPSVITYAPGSSAALAEALERVLDNPQAARAQVQRPEIHRGLDAEIALLMETAGGAALSAEHPVRGG